MKLQNILRRGPTNISALIYRSTLRSSLVPIFTIEAVLLVLYFGINFYISQKNQSALLLGAQLEVQEIASREVSNINQQLTEVTRLAKIMQADHEVFFRSSAPCSLPNGEPQFKVHDNGVYYKTNRNGGASLYYSSKTPIGPAEAEKARCSEVIDPLLKSLVDTNPLVTQAYLNTWDNMNRLYPFMDDAPGQYGPVLVMSDYNFYYDADATHNPQRKPVWTSVYLDPAGQGWMASVIVPIYKGDFLEGVSGLDVTVDAFVQKVLNLRLPWKSASLMVDGQGMILAMQEDAEKILQLRELKSHTYDANVSKTIEKPEEFNLLTRGDEATREQMKLLFQNKTQMASLKLGSVDYIVSQQIVPETGWRLLTLIDKADVFEEIARLKTMSDRIGYLAIVVMLVFYAIFFMYVQRKSRRLAASLSAPIENLSAITQAFVEKLKAPVIDEVGIKELDDLAASFTAMIREIEQRTRAYLDARIAAEASSRLKSIFLANMSHEIRTPLNGILGMAQLMTDPSTDETMRLEFAKIILQSGQNLHVLLSDILDLSNLEAGKLTLENHPCVPQEIAQEVVNQQQASATAKGLALSLECTVPPDQRFSGDPIRIKQMLGNLVGNAIKFTQQGSVQVQVRLVEDQAQQAVVEFSVADTGIGIPADKQHLLFQAFMQVDGSATRAFGGTGLGLSLVRLFAELMGGQVGADSTPGQGSRFWFCVPLHKVTASPQIANPESQQTGE